MIKNKIIENNHVIIYTSEPARFEIVGDFVIHGYKGTKINIEQEPCLFHDTDIKGGIHDLYSNIFSCGG